MTKIKICGIRRAEDIVMVNKYLPHYVGVIFASSKRRVSVHEAKTLLDELNPQIKKVGVFVNEEIDTILETAQTCNLQVVQIHGDESPEYIAQLKKSLFNKILNKDTMDNIEIWKAVRVKDEGSLKSLHQYRLNTFVLDAFSEGEYGGAGRIFDWDHAVNAKKYGNIVLAGGLNMRNVEQAIKLVKPFLVDVSSGVESDGYKDEIKIKGFVAAVRGLE